MNTPANPTQTTDPRAKTLSVTEVYHSIQGESTWAGLPCVFVRLTGCNLRCSWCDTAYAFHGGVKRTVGDVVDEALAYGCPLAEITGGEPLLHKACPDLAMALLSHGFTVLCETSGSLPIDVLPAGVVRIMDLKCPGSGECQANDWNNIARLKPEDEVKFVIADRADYEWSRCILREHRLDQRTRAVLFSPVFGNIDPRNLAAWILEDRLPVRFQLQLHKFIWDPAAKGV